MKKSDVLILTAGKIPADMASIFGDVPSGLIPINGKPTISWIIDELSSQGFNNFFITVGYKNELVEDFVGKKHTDGHSIKFIKVDYQSGPGNSIIDALKYIDTEDLLIFLGDTIINKFICLDENFVYVSKEFKEPSKWCLVETDKNNYVELFFDKKKVLKCATGLKALVGVYYLKNISLFQDIDKKINVTKRIEISEILDVYKQFEAIKCIECDEWFDIGHLDKYHESKIKLTQARHFNSLEFDSLTSVITKRSTNKEKFIKEIQWYLRVPKELSVLTPRVVEYNIGNDPFLKLEYYGYPTVSELFVYGDLHPKIWEQIINKLVGILSLFRRYKGDVSYDSYRFMYLEKTLQRIEELIDVDKDFRQIFSYDYVFINEQSLINFRNLSTFVKNKVEVLYETANENNCIIHGDFCSPNILYDVNSGVVRLIDPRGVWGENYYGDIRYDVAKLRHSFAGKYDFIVNDLFTVNRKENCFELSIFNTELHEEVKKILDRTISNAWNLDDIIFIEGLLFISMIPLHKGDKNRQLAMYCMGLKLLNEVYLGENT